jgi:hypothetical protein
MVTRLRRRVRILRGGGLRAGEAAVLLEGVRGGACCPALVRPRAIRGGVGLPAAGPTVDDAIRVACELFGVERGQVIDHCRQVGAANLARKLAMWAAVDVAGVAAAEAGRTFERDHTTVMAARDWVRARVEDSPEVGGWARVVRGLLTGRVDARG